MGRAPEGPAGGQHPGVSAVAITAPGHEGWPEGACSLVVGKLRPHWRSSHFLLAPVLCPGGLLGFSGPGLLDPSPVAIFLQHGGLALPPCGGQASVSPTSLDQPQWAAPSPVTFGGLECPGGFLIWTLSHPVDGLFAPHWLHCRQGLQDALLCRLNKQHSWHVPPNWAPRGDARRRGRAPTGMWDIVSWAMGNTVQLCGGLALLSTRPALFSRDFGWWAWVFKRQCSLN